MFFSETQLAAAFSDRIKFCVCSMTNDKTFTPPNPAESSERNPNMSLPNFITTARGRQPKKFTYPTPMP